MVILFFTQVYLQLTDGNADMTYVSNRQELNKLEAAELLVN
jgi:hypothetical protein